MKLICSAFVLVLLVTLCSAAKCPDGKFWDQPRPWFEGKCEYCSRGWYCPGDDNSYKCDGDSIADVWGASACVPCPKNLPYASVWKTFCMPPDVPKDAQSVYLAFGDTSVTLKSRHLITEVSFLEFTRISTLTFYNASSSSYPFGMYLSTKSGNPNENNYEMKAYGQNVTFAFDKPKLYYIPVYVTLDAPGTLYLSAAMEGTYTDVYEIDKSHEVGFKTYHYKVDENPYVFFQVPNIQQRSRVNITFSLIVQHPGILITDIYASPNTELEYPNAHNYKNRASNYATDKTSLTSTLILDDVFPGTLYYAGSTDVPVNNEYLTIETKVVITPKQ